MTDRELMQIALELLQTNDPLQELIELLRARLAQPDAVINGMPVYEGPLSKSQRIAQPAAWIHWITADGERFPQLTLVPRTGADTPLYTTPQPQREWQGLTDDELRDALLAAGGWRETVRAIEAKLKEKNT